MNMEGGGKMGLEYIDSGTNDLEWERFRYTHNNFEMEWTEEYITAFCGGTLLCDFSYSYNMEMEARDMARGEPMSAGLEEFFKRWWVAMARQMTSQYEDSLGHYTHKVTWWEIDRRPMYWAGKTLFKCGVGRDGINPNSDNLAGQFTSTLNYKRVIRYEEELQ